MNNAYELYYLKNKKSNLSGEDRARKILSRVYEAISYMHFLRKDKKINNLEKKISIQIEKGATLQESKKIFEDIVLFYKKKIKNFRNKKV